MRESPKELGENCFPYYVWEEGEPFPGGEVLGVENRCVIIFDRGMLCKYNDTPILGEHEFEKITFERIATGEDIKNLLRYVIAKIEIMHCENCKLQNDVDKIKILLKRYGIDF